MATFTTKLFNNENLDENSYSNQPATPENILKLVIGEVKLFTSLNHPCYYAGIGSRSTPEHAITTMHHIANYFKDINWILRTGCAEGADQAFLRYSGNKHQAFIPWDGFASRDANSNRIYLPTDAAFGIASKYHPNWKNLKDSDKKLMARNSHQVLGHRITDAADWSKVVICWTPDAADGLSIKTSRDTGGTGQAIRIAAAHGIPVINLAKYIR